MTGYYFGGNYYSSLMHLCDCVGLQDSYQAIRVYLRKHPIVPRTIEEGLHEADEVIARYLAKKKRKEEKRKREAE